MKKIFEKYLVCILLALVPGKSRPEINWMSAQQPIVAPARLDAGRLMKCSCLSQHFCMDIQIQKCFSWTRRGGGRTAASVCLWLSCGE